MKRKIYNPVIFWPKEPRLGQATPGKVSYQWVIWTQCPSAWILCAWSGHHGISMPPHQHRKYDRTIISYALDQESYNQCWYEELKHCLRPHPFFSGFIIQRLSSYEHKVRWNHLWDTNTGKQIQTKDYQMRHHFHVTKCCLIQPMSVRCCFFSLFFVLRNEVGIL